MNKKRTANLMKSLILLSNFVIIFGAFLKLFHYTNGNLVLTIGFISGIILSSFEISRLKKIIEEYEDVSKK